MLYLEWSMDICEVVMREIAESGYASSDYHRSASRGRQIADEHREELQSIDGLEKSALAVVKRSGTVGLSRE